MAKIERKWLAHYIDANFGNGNTNYVRLGQDLEAFAEELNPQVDVKKNILGEQNVTHNGYQVQSSVEPFYAYEGDAIFNRLKKIANERLTGDDCVTTRVEVLFDSNGSVVEAWRENCWAVPQSYGGDTSGVQIPFQILNSGGRTVGTWDTSGKTFTPNA